MPAAPNKKTIKLDRKAPTLVVLFGPPDGSAPIAEDEVDWLHPIRIERSVGGSRVNAVTFEYDLGLVQEQIVDKLAPRGITRQVEIRELDAQGEPTRVLLWGKLAAQPISLRNQSIQYHVRIDKHLLGIPLQKTPFFNGVFSVPQDVLRPLVFNPEIDEIVYGNGTDKTDDLRGGMYLFCDVAGPDTAAARATSGVTATKWKIFEAAHLLCWLLNAEQKFVLNPSLEELAAALGSVDVNQEKLKNLQLSRGKYLPELLDELLTPFGCSWFVSLELDDEGNSVRRLKFFVRNQGVPRELFLQRKSDSDTPTKPDPAKSSLKDLGLKYDIVNIANRIVGTSSRRQVEITTQLFKGWPASQDGFDRETLKNNAEAQRLYPHAGRLFVFNESGAHTGLRPEIYLPDMVVYFGRAVLPIARKFLPCISRLKDGVNDKLESRGYVVEWWDPNEEIWKPVSALTNGAYAVLQQECGIMFENIPEELWDALQDNPDNCRVRITATIEEDQGLEAIAERQDSSPNADDVTLYLDLSDKFHDRWVHVSSIFIAEIASADVTNDFAKLQEYVNKVREIEDAAEISCSAQLEGIDHPEYELGDLITSVNGINLNLIRDTPRVGVQGKFLQIVGIALDVKAQTTDLMLETFDEERLT